MEACVLCMKILPSDSNLQSIFSRDDVLKKCLAYKINKISGEDFLFQVDGSFICSDCHGILLKIHILEQDIVNRIRTTRNSAPTKVEQLPEVQPVSKVQANEEDADNSMGNEKGSEEYDDMFLNDFEEPNKSIIDLNNSKVFEIGVKNENIPIKDEPPNEIEGAVGIGQNIKSEGDDFPCANDYDSRPFKCDICDKSFRRKQHMQIHRIIHTSDAVFKCEFCSFVSVYKNALEKHRKIHSNPLKPYFCKICHKSFAKETSFQSHQQYHRGERRFKCDYCKIAFNNMSHLKVHLIMHTGERPFGCETCSRRFTQITMLKRHRIKCHRENNGIKL